MGSVSSNLETHMRKTHPEEAIILDKAKADFKKQEDRK